jgi:hypothetical protein
MVTPGMPRCNGIGPNILMKLVARMILLDPARPIIGVVGIFGRRSGGY